MLKILAVLIVLLAAFWAVTLWRAGQNEARSEAAHPPEGQLLDVDGHQVHAVVMGEGPDVVLIHGASGNTRDMTFSLAPRLADRYRVLVFDRPGLGYTAPLAEDTLAAQAALLQKAAAQLGANAPIVVGQSYGGAVALAWALNHPSNVSGLALLAAASNPWDTPLDPFYKITSHPVGSAVVVPLITAWIPESRVTEAVEGVFTPQTAPEGYAAYFGPGLTLRRASMRANARQRAAILGEIIAQHTRYGQIEMPVEILHGTADDTVSLRLHSERLVGQIDGAVLTLLDGIGHMPQHVAEDDVVAAIDRVVERIGGQ